MTTVQKNEIARLRGKGIGYIKIAAALGISENTVKSYCRRNNLASGVAAHTDNPISDRCRQCGEALSKSRQPTKRFCSDKCRMAWWKAHPEAVNRKAVYQFTCACCGQPFEAYGNAKRRYCSRACFGATRRADHD